MNSPLVCTENRKRAGCPIEENLVLEGDSKSTKNDLQSQGVCHPFIVIKSDFLGKNGWEEVGLYNQYNCIISTDFMNAVIIVLCNNFVRGFLGRNGTLQSNVVLIV